MNQTSRTLQVQAIANLHSMVESQPESNISAIISDITLDFLLEGMESMDSEVFKKCTEIVNLISQTNSISIID